MDEKAESSKLNEAIKKLNKTPYDLGAMESLFELEAIELTEFAEDPENFTVREFMNISRYIFRELNKLMAMLGFHDKDQTNNIRFNTRYVENCNAITTELLSKTALQEIVAMNRLSLILHDYLSPYAHILTDKKNDDATKEG